MNETKFRKRLKEVLEMGLEKMGLGNKYSFKENMNLIYKVIISENLEYEPNDPKNPKRGRYAFQTDITIVENNLPLVIIETKYGDFTSHDVLTYSTKALKHKEIYPYIRYGLVVGGKDRIDNKFFTHNVGFDFAIALREINETDFDETDLGRLNKIIKAQLKSAKRLLDIFADKKGVKEFNSIIKVETENKKERKRKRQ